MKREPLSRPGVPCSASLLVVLDDSGRPDARLRGVVTELPERPTLAQQIPALIELDLELIQSLTVGVRELPLLEEPVLFLDEMFDVPAYRLVGLLFGHECTSLGLGWPV